MNVAHGLAMRPEMRTSPSEPPMATDRSIPRLSSEFWRSRPRSAAWEYAEVFGVIGAVTFAGWYAPLSYHAFGHIYLFTVIALSFRVGRWPALAAAVGSAVAWNFVFVPPRLSFAVLGFDDTLMLGTYFVVAIIGGQLTARIRAQQWTERLRERRATALFHLARDLASAHTFDEAARAAVAQSDGAFDAHTAFLLLDERGVLRVHPASSFAPDDADLQAAGEAVRQRIRTARFSSTRGKIEGLYLPLLRADTVTGVFGVRLPRGTLPLSSAQQDLITGFASQIALMVDREKLRVASEREKLLAESDRLHRTLLDSVSHELKTPLCVLRSAAEKLSTDDVQKRIQLTHEIQTATHRLEHLVSNLLNQSRLESFAIRPQMDWCDARDLVTAARRAVGDTLSERTLTIEIPEDLPLFFADTLLMEQVLANLLLNACLHTPAGTPIQISAGVEPDRSRVFITVADRGPGLSPDVEDNLFQKFQRGEKARPGGIGLGLAIVRGFMLAQQGEVSAANRPGGGAIFTVYLRHARHDGVLTDDSA